MESKTDLLERLIEEEQKIRERAEELGVQVGPQLPEEAKAPFRPKEGIPSTDLTDRELSKLFAETRDILDIYTIDYIAEHFDEAQELHKNLQDKSFNPDALIGSRITQNIHELKTRIDAVKEQETPTKALEEFLADCKRILDLSDEWEPGKAKRKFADLLRKEQFLPKNVDRPLEEEIGEYLTEIGKRIQRKEKKSSEDIGEELLEEISALIGSRDFDPEGYNKVAKKFQEVADDLPEDLRMKIRDRIRECYAKMKETEKKAETEKWQRERRTKQFYWDSFASGVEQLRADLEKAQPGEFFRTYDMYEQLLDSLENAELTDIPAPQVERIKSLLDQCYYMLEELRKRA
ncbi:MAG: hypothetical protein HXS46_18780 [Theionarchaea archaeon]|nr:hypothetical protein [Theionarchaea archaeon]